MVRTRDRWNCLPRPLAFLLVLLPVLAPAARAQPAPSGGAIFDSFGTGMGAEADNGFGISVVNGKWRHKGHSHLGASGSITSSWGEEMPLRFWFNPDGSFAIEFDGSAILHYAFDDFGGLARVTAVTPTGVGTAAVGARAERFAAGALDPMAPEFLDLDVEPYRLLLEHVAGNHSVRFLDGVDRLEEQLQRLGNPAVAGCFGDIAACTGAILLWSASVGTIAAACTVGNAFSLGAGCLAAILAHEGAGAVAVGSCVNAIQNCRDHDGHRDDPGGGCNGPGGPE